MTIRSIVKAKYTKQLKILRIKNGRHLSERRGVFNWSLQYVYVILYTTHKNLRKNDERPVLSYEHKFTYNMMIKYPILAAAFWKEMQIVNDTFTPITIYGKVYNLPQWGR